MAATAHDLNQTGVIAIADLMKCKPNPSLKLNRSNDIPPQTLQDSHGDVINTIRENIVVRRAESFACGGAASGGRVTVTVSYVHGRAGAEVGEDAIQVRRAGTDSGVAFALTPY